MLSGKLIKYRLINITNSLTHTIFDFLNFSLSCQKTDAASECKRQTCLLLPNCKEEISIKVAKETRFALRKLLLKIQICKLNSSNLQPVVASNSRCLDACTFLIFYATNLRKRGICGFDQTYCFFRTSHPHGSRDGYYSQDSNNDNY